MSNGSRSREAELSQKVSDLEKELEKYKLRAERYHHLFLNMEHEVHVWELVYNSDNSIRTWKLLDANRMALNNWNKELEDVQGKTTDEIFGTDATLQFLPVVEKIFSEKKPYSWETYFDGTDQVLSMTSIPCDGYFISTGIDISFIKRTENDLRETVLKLKEAISAGNIGLWDWDLATNQTFFSPEWKRQLGYEDHEIKNEFQEWEGRVHPDDVDKTLKKINATLTEGNEYHDIEFRMRHKNGSYRWIIAHASLLKDDQGLPVRLVGSHIDVTERKVMEETVLQQQKMQALGTLAGGIAHDFNNLLTPILGYAQLLKLRLEEAQKEAEYVSQIEDSASRAKDLVQQILIMNRESVEHIEAVYIDKLVAEVLTLFKTTAHKDISITQDFEDELPAIGADPSELYRVVLNLCTNAIQAMPRGGELNIQVRQELARITTDASDSVGNIEPSDCICLTIRDTGVGMDEPTQSRIFEPFFTTKLKGEERGSGLGLSIVASIVQQHKGMIEIDSKLGKGTEFRLYFPIIPADMPPPTETEEILEYSGDEAILLVDDETSLCDLGASLLSQIGYQVDTFQNAQSALKALENDPNRYTLIITDYAMPKMNGLEFIEKLRALDLNIPIVMVTGFTNLISEENRIKWGCDALIGKPYTMRELSRTIGQLKKQ
ncbi:PAS domain-containing hybrid sensor histidine kinase/response regulator [Lacimicrobium sp. SS2-24]|uniref:PAS domain-containing hybrid sensor histidine kinase/response regulator n=1 Tax=Lacimicrobium sp. SS2-24 TaxID=2005569 RepID=UPI000B4B8A88|nr:PAS domain-containing hybrid sensor histidine kinase/response regulator [Lacimicrobium sp. SS2-24]